MKRAALLLALAACAHPEAAAPPSAVEREVAQAAAPDAAHCPTRAPAFAPDSHADELWGAQVEQICLLGASEEAAPHLLELLVERQGTPLNADAVRTDLQLLFTQVVVKDATAVAERLPSKGVRLYYLVSEYPRFVELKVSGNQAVGEDMVKSALELGLPANPVVLKTAIDELQKSYGSIGYAKAKLDYVVVPLEPGKARVELHVDEGPRWMVSAIRLEGAKQVKEKELKAALKSSVGAPYAAEMAERDAAALNAVYFDHGLVQSTVAAAPPKELPGPAGAVELVFTIHEGPVFQVGQVKLEGFSLGAEQQVLKGLETKQKTVFSRSAVTRDMERLKHLASEKGTEVEVTPLTKVDLDKKRIDLTFSLEKKTGATRF